MLTEEQKQYIIDNKDFQCANGMAEELGVKPNQVYTFCYRSGFEPRSEGDLNREYIKSHKHWSAERIAKNTGLGLDTIRLYARQMKICLPKEKEPEPVEKKDFKPGTSFWDRIKKLNQRQMINEILDRMENNLK